MKTELLAPAGSLEKLKTAVTYGADAVYIGGPEFSLRTASQNFYPEEMAEGVLFAHKRGVLVYVAINGFLFDHELDRLPAFLEQCESLGVDAIIASDLGVIQTIRKHCKVPVHLSTQASCLNIEGGKFWRDQGVKRLILGRETTIDDARKIKNETGLEVELFVHGALCMSYSGHCTISNYTLGRDSNRGGCAQSCRFEYGLEAKSSNGEVASKTTTFLSSKDLNALSLIADLKETGIDSLKIEGRMKTQLYAGVTTKVYREALDCEGRYTENQIVSWQEELASYGHREYTENGMGGADLLNSVFAQEASGESTTEMAATVIDRIGDEAILELRTTVRHGECLEYIPPTGPTERIYLDSMFDLRGRELHEAKPNTMIMIKALDSMVPHTLLRKRRATP